jgi:hypothetical protein
MLLAVFKELGLRKIRMSLNLNHGRLDARGFVKRRQVGQADVR